jgi:hypothetical protein
MPHGMRLHGQIHSRDVTCLCPKLRSRSDTIGTSVQHEVRSLFLPKVRSAQGLEATPQLHTDVLLALEHVPGAP